MPVSVQIVKPQDVAELVLDHRQQVRPAERRAGWWSCQLTAVALLMEFLVIGRRGIHEPAASGSAAVNEDLVADRDPELVLRQVADLDLHVVQRGKATVAGSERLGPEQLRLGHDRRQLRIREEAHRTRRIRLGTLGRLIDRLRACSSVAVAQVDLSTTGVTGLWITRGALLIFPGDIPRLHQTDLAERLAVAGRIAAVLGRERLVRAVALRERV